MSLDRLLGSSRIVLDQGDLISRCLSRPVESKDCWPVSKRLEVSSTTQELFALERKASLGEVNLPLTPGRRPQAWKVPWSGRSQLEETYRRHWGDRLS